MPISAPKDANRIAVLLATQDTDGITIVNVRATGNALLVRDGASGVSIASVNSQRDANRIPALWATSSADGVTPIPVYCDSAGNLLVKST